MVHSMWDPRILDLFVIQPGVRIENPSSRKIRAAVFLQRRLLLQRKSSKLYDHTHSPQFKLELINSIQASFRSDELVVDALQAYSEATKEKPVHVIWGTIKDVKSPETRGLLSDTSAGRQPVSVRFIEDAGHLVVQKPEEVATIILDLLEGKSATDMPKL
ncbi:hypothetical protein PQX77_018456 [Marasmius sp. AFHP31]|nr:hypothetical protein PQX77_018456 [Marasmius sp. AFHP31]